jgi:hypothetical protein
LRAARLQLGQGLLEHFHKHLRCGAAAAEKQQHPAIKLAVVVCHHISPVITHHRTRNKYHKRKQ